MVYIYRHDLYTMVPDEREKRKDQLLQLQKSKQERTDAELSNLRQVSFNTYNLPTTYSAFFEIQPSPCNIATLFARNLCSYLERWALVRENRMDL